MMDWAGSLFKGSRLGKTEPSSTDIANNDFDSSYEESVRFKDMTICDRCGHENEIYWREKPMEWIDIKDQKPEWGQVIIAYKSNTNLNPDDGIILTDMYDQDITHWLPLPTAPAKKDNANYVSLDKTTGKTERSHVCTKDCFDLT